jgi:hypothetical protein
MEQSSSPMAQTWLIYYHNPPYLLLFLLLESYTTYTFKTSSHPSSLIDSSTSWSYIVLQFYSLPLTRISANCTWNHYLLWQLSPRLHYWKVPLLNLTSLYHQPLEPEHQVASIQTKHRSTLGYLLGARYDAVLVYCLVDTLDVWPELKVEIEARE